METLPTSDSHKPKQRVSLISLSHSFGKDLVCNIDHDKYLYISSTMAEIFSFSTSFMIGSSLPAITDCGPNLYPLLSNSSNANHLFKQTSNASNIAKQAAIFISLIGDVVQSTPADIVTVTPSLHALQQCLRSGWRPDSISNEVLSVSIALLDSDELETSSVAENLLSCGMQTSSALANQILIALATSMQRLKEDRGSENRWLSSTYQRVLSKSLGEFIRHSFRSLLVQAADSALQAAQEPRRSHIAGAGASGLGTEKLGLGDKLEVWVSPDWVVGTIVKSNALTGEFYIEHPVTGLSADHSSSASRAVVVTTLPKTSRMLRLLRTSDDEPHNDEPALAAHTPRPELSSRDIFATEELEGGEQQLRGVADVVALVYGSEDAMSSSGTLQVIDQTSLPHSANRTGRSPKDTPICENGHQCTVSKIDQNSAGFMCSYCSKLYASDFDLPVFGSDPTRFPLSRFALAQYKWSCPGCHFDACLTCFPHPDYPAGGTGHLDRNRDRDRDCSAFDRSSHTKDAAPVKVVNIPEAGQRCTICLLGRNEQSYCRVRAEPSVTSAELSRVSHGSVIDVMDVPGSDFFQLLNSSGGGYVKKQLGKMCYWKRLPRDRYMIHGELEDMVFFDRSEFTPLINLGALNSSGTCSSSSERAFPDSNSSSSARQGSDDAERHQVDMLANLLVLLVHHDSLVKDAFKSFAGGGHEVKSDSQSSNGGDIDPMSEKLDLESSAKRILSTALSLFKKTAESLGEIVIPSVDCFEDDADDGAVTSNEIPTTVDLLAQTTASNIPAFSLRDPQSALLSLPVVAQDSALMATKVLLHPGVRPRERVAFFVLGAVFDLVCASLTALAERRIAKPDSSISLVESLALEIVAVVADSEFKVLMNQYFYRVMIAKAGIRAKLCAQIFLNNKQCHRLVDSMEPALEAFEAIKAIEAAYRSVILHASVSVSPLFEVGVADKLKGTVLVCGFATLANGIVELNHRISAHEDLTLTFDDGAVLKQALRAFILQPKDRFAKSSRNMRKLLKEICQYASEHNVSIVEGLWRETISEMVLEKCTAPTVSRTTATTNAAASLDYMRLQQVESRSDGLVDYLIATLGEARCISRTDMAVTNQCSMSADLAVVTAFRRLPKEKSLELTKALVVRVSSLIDSLKTESMSRSWAQAIENVTDLIQVLFTQSSAEFQHFYELLLARRLLRNRYISLSTECRVLAQLPAMSKSSLMIRDIEQSATAMHSFRKFLVQQVDFHDLHLPREMTELALTGQHLQINSLTGNVWPSIWIKPLSYASLALPAGLDLIKRAYMQYFDAQNTTRFDAWKPNDKYKSLQISAGAGTEDTSPRILGIYDPSSEMSDGWPVYEIRASTSSGNDGSSGGSGGCNSSILEYSLRTCSWQIKRRSDRGKNAGWAYCHSPPGVAPEQLEKSWFVWRKADKKWVPQAISVASATLAQTKPRSLRRVIWCHAAGTLTIQVALDNGRHSHVLVTEVQAAVLLSFNSMVRPKSLPVSLTFSQIQATLQLSSGELKGVLTTLVSAEAPVLQRSAPKSAPLSPEMKKTKQSHFSEEITTEDTFQLSNAFLGGDLGGLSANNPIILSSIEVDKHNSDDYLFDAGVNSLYGWRNELIDASVVRVLKDAAAQKSGEFANHCRQRFAALSIDSLCYRVRLALNGRSNVSSEDIMRRSERLVSIGVIDKVVGNSDSFRSVAYCYIADVEAPTTVTTDSSNNNNNNSDLLGTGNVVCDKVYGQDLYNHLRIVLGIRSSSSSSLPGGVSKTQFVHRFISWMINANCDVASASVSRRKNHPVNFLDVFAGLIVEFLKTAEVQTNALQLQFCYGIHSACGTINTDRAFKSLRGLNALQMLAHTLTTTIHNGLPNLHNYLALDRVYLEHLPAPIVQDMLNYFRGLLQEPVVKYDQPNVHPAADLSGIGKLGADAFPLPLTSSVADVYTEEDTGRFTPTTEFFGQAGSMNPPPHMRAEADDGLGHSELMKRDIQVMWNRTAVVHKHALIHKFGFPEALLTTLNIAPAIAPVVSESSLSLSPRKESKSSQVRGARQSKDQVRMSFQQLVAATLLTASAEATDSLPSADSAVDSTSFGYLLEEYFFNRLVDHMAELFGTDLQFVDAQQVEEATESGSSVATANAAPSTAAGLQSGPEEDEVRIPCEFCTDSIRVSLFEAHTLACRTGRALEAHPPDPDRPNRPRLLVQPQGVNIQNVRGGCSADPPGVRRLKRPDSSSGVAIALMEALLNSVTATACEVQSAVWESRPEELFTAKALGGDSDEEAHPLQQLRPANAFTFFLESAFDVLDRDGDGYLNPNDFSVVETSFVDLLDTVDPARLYGTARIHLEGAGLKMPSKFPEQPKKGPPSAALSTNNSMDNLAEEDLILLSTPVPLAKTSSLWRSVSHEKSLPSADASRSYSGLEEAEMEMTALVHRAMLIIDDSAAVSTSLLIHYKWDVKTLVEEYIENSRAVRLATGLGPRNQPPFLRLDLHNSEEHVSLLPSQPWDSPVKSLPNDARGAEAAETLVCGICQDTLVPTEAFALTCRHWYCEGCWQGYIHNAVNERSVTYTCPHPDCKFIVTSDMQCFFCDEEHNINARTVLIKSFVEDRRGKQVLATYCKNPRGCGGIVLMADDADYSEAVCSLCSTTFCAACDMPPHAPATCEMVSKWEEKGGYIETGRSEDVEARKLKHLTTKPCPKCGVRIEKSGGCPHMTCVQPSCKYQFCWECAGEYHTSTTCSRPKVKLDSNSVLAFDEYDRQCANHFLARKVALRGKAESHRLLEQTHRQEDAVVLRIIAEGWGVLADAQSALAHSCIVMLNVKSAKLQFIFDCQKAQALALQQKFEETWTTLETFSLVEAKSAIRDLRLRLRDYLLTVHTEILVERPRQSRSKTKAAAASTPSRARTRSLSVSSPGGPGGRQSGPSSLNRAVRSGSCALDDISSKDLPLLQFLQRHTTTSSSISASATSAEYSQNFQVEVASTVFGDAFGGSWRVYAPFLPAAALEKSEHSPPRVRPLIGSNLHFKLDLPSPAPPPSAETAAGIRRPPPRSAVLPLMFSHRSSPAGTTRPSAPAGPRGDWSPTATTASSSSAFTVEALMEQMRDLEELGFAHRTTAPATDEEHDEEDDQDEDSEEPLQEMVKRARK